MKYIKKPVVIDAFRWFACGEHAPMVIPYGENPDRCQYCGNHLSEHGYIKTLEGGHIVCPGDWIITGVQGEHYPCKNDIFHQTYSESPSWNTVGG